MNNHADYNSKKMMIEHGIKRPSGLFQKKNSNTTN